MTETWLPAPVGTRPPMNDLIPRVGPSDPFKVARFIVENNTLIVLEDGRVEQQRVDVAGEVDDRVIVKARLLSPRLFRGWTSQLRWFATRFWAIQLGSRPKTRPNATRPSDTRKRRFEPRYVRADIALDVYADLALRVVAVDRRDNRGTSSDGSETSAMERGRIIRTGCGEEEKDQLSFYQRSAPTELGVRTVGGNSVDEMPKGAEPTRGGARATRARWCHQTGDECKFRVVQASGSPAAPRSRVDDVFLDPSISRYR